MNSGPWVLQSCCDNYSLLSKLGSGWAQCWECVMWERVLVMSLATGSDALSYTGTHHKYLWEIPSVTLLAWPLPWWASWDTSARPCYSSSCHRCSTSSTHCPSSCISSPALATVYPGSTLGHHSLSLGKSKASLYICYVGLKEELTLSM